jgi:hypothetical protein
VLACGYFGEDDERVKSTQEIFSGYIFQPKSQLNADRSAS